METNDYIHLYMPYYIKQIKKGKNKYIFLNGEHKPLGFHNKNHIRYEEYPIVVTILGMNKELAKKLSCEDSDNLDIIYLYKKNANRPQACDICLKDYLDRVKLLYKLKLEFENKGEYAKFTTLFSEPEKIQKKINDLKNNEIFIDEEDLMLPYRKAQSKGNDFKEFILQNIDLKFVKKLLLEEGFTYKEFAEILNMPEKEFTRKMNFHNNEFTIKELNTIAYFIDVPIISLLK